MHSIYLGCKLITILKHSLFVIVSNLKCWSFFFSLDSITIMKVKLLSTMHSRVLYDASVFALYAIWFVDMTLHCAVYCCILNWMSRFYSMNTILLSPFNLLSYLSIVTTNELFKTVVAFFFFRPITSIQCDDSVVDSNERKYAIHLKCNEYKFREEESTANWKWLFEEKEYWNTMPLHNL